MMNPAHKGTVKIGSVEIEKGSDFWMDLYQNGDFDGTGDINSITFPIDDPSNKVCVHTADWVYGTGVKSLVFGKGNKAGHYDLPDSPSDTPLEANCCRLFDNTGWFAAWSPIKGHQTSLDICLEDGGEKRDFALEEDYSHWLSNTRSVRCGEGVRLSFHDCDVAADASCKGDAVGLAGHNKAMTD